MVLSFITSAFTSLYNGLEKSRRDFFSKIRSIFSHAIDDETLEQIESILYEADLGSKIVQDLLLAAKEFARTHKTATVQELIPHLEKVLSSFFIHRQHTVRFSDTQPSVFIIVGANGNGKTTSIAKLAHVFKKEGRSILFAACDTYRAAAQEQLAYWADKLSCDIVQGSYKSDPAACAYDAIIAAQARKKDIVLIDTAGRLDNKTHLMKELEKIYKTTSKAQAGAPHEILLVLEATSGQNALELVQNFKRYVPISGLIVTKLDGTAKGGAALAIERTLDIPIVYIGVGEKIEDLIPYNPQEFIHALFQQNEKDS